MIGSPPPGGWRECGTLWALAATGVLAAASVAARGSRNVPPPSAVYRVEFPGGYEDPWEGTWAQLAQANAQDQEVLARVAGLGISDSWVFGGGAAPQVVTTRIR